MISVITQIYVFTIVVVVIGIFIYISTNGPLCLPPKKEDEEQKEGFFTTPNGAIVDGGIHGYNMITNQMINKPIDQVIQDIKDHGRVTDDGGAVSIGVSEGNGFEGAWSCQREVQSLDAQSASGYHQPQVLDKMSKKISQVGNNADMCIISRAGYKPTKLILMPNANISVMEEKYYPERKKNHQLIVANSVTPVQGFDLNIERIGLELNSYHNSSISHHNRTSRIPTASGTGLNPTGNAGDGLVKEIHDGSGTTKTVINAKTSAGDKAIVYDQVQEDSGTKISSKYAIDGSLPVEATEMAPEVQENKEGFVYMHK